MKRAVVAAALASLAWHAIAAGALAAKVNNVEITAQEVDEYNKAISRKNGFLYKPGVVADRLIVRELLAQEAIRRGADKIADRSELADQVLKEYAAANPLGEDDVKREYERLKAGAPNEKEYRLLTIAVKTEAEAKSIIAGLNAGKPFASFVPLSIDENSKRDGGASDWMKPTEMNPQYLGALNGLKPGSHRQEPLRTNYGYVVLKLDGVRDDAFPSYAEVRDSLIVSVKEAWLERLVKPLRDKATIVQYEGYKNRVINLSRTP